MKALTLLVALLIMACATAPQLAETSPTRRQPTVVIENQSAQKVDVYDGAFRLASVMPGARAVGTFYGTGTRSITVRSVAFTTRTRAERFEENRSWTLTVTVDGKAELDLRP